MQELQKSINKVVKKLDASKDKAESETAAAAVDADGDQKMADEFEKLDSTAKASNRAQTFASNPELGCRWLSCRALPSLR